MDAAAELILAMLVLFDAGQAISGNSRNYLVGWTDGQMPTPHPHLQGRQSRHRRGVVSRSCYTAPMGATRKKRFRPSRQAVQVDYPNWQQAASRRDFLASLGYAAAGCALFTGVTACETRTMGVWADTRVPDTGPRDAGPDQQPDLKSKIWDLSGVAPDMRSPLDQKTSDSDPDQ